MKNRTDNILLYTFFASLIFYCFILPYYFCLIAGTALDSPEWNVFYNWLSMSFHAVPAFCLQLLLCRRTRRWVAALHGAAVGGLVLWAVYGSLTSTSWDRLGFAILLELSAAPAIGCILAWIVYGWTLHQKNRQ